MTDVVTVLRFEEPARFDPDRLEGLCRDIGETQAEYDVAVGLERIMIARQDMAAIGATLARLRRVGERSVYAIYDIEDMSV